MQNVMLQYYHVEVGASFEGLEEYYSITSYTESILKEGKSKILI